MLKINRSAYTSGFAIEVNYIQLNSFATYSKNFPNS